MAGIFYDPVSRRLLAVRATPDSQWTLVTHNVNAGAHLCRRIMSEWLSPEDMVRVEWTVHHERLSA
ncbi:MAG TPA: hypothetical protein PL082_01265 [Tepidiformaceae bacterium]|nr:hypothetical protein [Tepidiformaceae bacterium]